MVLCWCVYLMSRVLCCKWPFWEHPVAFFSVNQINDRLFEGYGLEILPFGLIVVATSWSTTWINSYQRRHYGVTTGWVRAAIPIILYLAVALLIACLGAAHVPTVDTGTCPQADRAAAAAAGMFG